MDGRTPSTSFYPRGKRPITSPTLPSCGAPATAGEAVISSESKTRRVRHRGRKAAESTDRAPASWWPLSIDWQEPLTAEERQGLRDLAGNLNRAARHRHELAVMMVDEAGFVTLFSGVNRKDDDGWMRFATMMADVLQAYVLKRPVRYFVGVEPIRDPECSA